MDFGRLITAMVTPFDEKGQIDWDQTAKLIDYLIEQQKSETIVVSGTTGEAPTLTHEEKLHLFDFAVKQAAGRCKIIAGTGSNSTQASIILTKEAEKLGVDGALLVVPYYNKPNQEGIYRHFEAIAVATCLPIMLYNVPSRTVVSMNAQTVLRLAQLHNIVALKECAPLEQVAAIVSGASTHFKVYSGEDCSALPALAVGAHGIVSVASHIVGAEMHDMISSYLNGRVQEASKLHQKLLPLFKGLFESPHPVPNPVAVKFMLNERGMHVGDVRLPLVPATLEEQDVFRNLIY